MAAAEKLASKFFAIAENWVRNLNDDRELDRRLKGFKTFAGGPTPFPGPGPYPRPTIAYDPSGWSNAKGYSSTLLHGTDIVEISVPEEFICTIRVDKGQFLREERKANDPCISLELPKDLLKAFLLTKHQLLWTITDDRAKIKYKEGIGLSDWITIFEILVVAQETIEKKSDLWKIAENL
jgi:hypothetical protein